MVGKNKDWSALASGLESLRLGESNGVLGLKAEIDLIYTLLPLVILDPNKVYIFPLYQPFITPSLSPSRRLYEPWALRRLYEPEAITLSEPRALRRLYEPEANTIGTISHLL